MPERVSTEEIVDAYRETGSVWRAGKRLGLSGQSVHERLRSVGYRLQGARWTSEEEYELQSLAMEDISLGEISSRLGRTFAACACKASELQISFRGTKPKETRLPRGAGFDKRSTERHMTALEHSSLNVTRFARSKGLSLELFVQACQRHCPDRWERYVEANADLPKKTCPYCQKNFAPNSGRQEYCSRQCGANSRKDIAYFGGKRRDAVGMETGECQLCHKKPKILHAHHMLGKENDEDNELLIALCPGCHQLVGQTAARKFLRDSEGWENFISLVMTRAWGDKRAQIEKEAPNGYDLYVEVSIERWPFSEDYPGPNGEGTAAAKPRKGPTVPDGQLALVA